MRPLGIEHHGVDGAGVDQRIRLAHDGAERQSALCAGGGTKAPRVHRI